MPDRFAAAMLVAIVEMDDLVALAFADDLRDDCRAGDLRLADDDLTIFFDHQYVAQGHLIADGIRQKFDINFVADGDAVLFSTGFQNCKHKPSTFYPKWQAIILGNIL